MADTKSNFSWSLGLGDVFGFGYNLFKDIFNIDRGRDLDVSRELMALQNQYNLQQQQKAFNQQWQLLNRQNQFNEQNMATQFAMNNYLSNRGRDILNSRLSGVNPTAASSPSGSVSLPSVAAPAATGFPAASSPYSRGNGTGNLTSLGNIFSNLKQSDTARIAANASAAKNEAEAANTTIHTITQLQRDKMQLAKMWAETKKSLADAGLTKKQIDKYDEEFNHRMNLLDAQAEEASATAFANTKNAETREKEQAANQRYQEKQNAINEMLAKVEQGKLALDKEKLPHVVDVLDAERRKYNADYSLTEQEVMWYADKMYTLLTKETWEYLLTKQRAINQEMENDFFIYDKIEGYVMDLGNLISQFVPKAPKGAPSNQGRIERELRKKITREVKYRDARGNPHHDKMEWHAPMEMPQ